MTFHQMTNARAAAPAPPQHQDHTTRLLQRWQELTALAVQAAAHQSGEEFEISTMQQQVEQVLRDRSPHPALLHLAPGGAVRDLRPGTHRSGSPANWDGLGGQRDRPSP